ncbi:formate dehydrogenase subunit gamma [Roseomonas eburnea]|uniref:Formate dehydrogenase subunit gamma n=1 Tax=Neoroseomonas eburnea TaxID=1346889 RepID=A0A9X9X6M4_9PROT|nr:formate dehydrogenase subunit gamma [Neoroseomonas eburnea]MBR0679360.1 formate dehydrogenase subunit gamma [Neoroseomonas eburnea]
MKIRILALLAALFIGVAGLPAFAQGSSQAPSVADEMAIQALLRGETVHGRITIPDQRAANLIQPQGREWREFHNVTLAWVGGVAVLGMLALLVVFRVAKGRIPIEGGPSGRTIQRFNAFERVNHWMVASCFIILALSGLNLTFGRHVLLPVIGPEAFTEVSLWGKLAHNFLAFPFTLGLVFMLLLWIKDNIPNGTDIRWLKTGGGLVGNAHPDSERFNAGQKGIFWITVLGGAAVAFTGYMLVFPFFFTDIAGMQLSHMIHSIVAVLMIAVMLAHIYIGTMGMEGAVEAMTTGQVDLNWAKQHHNLWVEEELAKGRAASPPTGAKAAGAD